MLYVTIANWRKHNPRRDIRTTSWLRLENRFWMDSKFWGFDSDEKMVWIALLSMASDELRPEVRIEQEQIAALLRIQPEKVQTSIDKLAELNLVTVSGTRTLRESDATGRDERDGTNGTVRDERDGTNNPSPTRETENGQNDGKPKIDYAKFGDLWNAFAVCNGLAKIRGMMDKRRSKIKKRHAEGLTLEKFGELLAMAERQPFLLGRNERGWTFDLDWLLLNRDNGLKVLEGKYLKSARGGTGNAAAVREAMERP